MDKGKYFGGFSDAEDVFDNFDVKPEDRTGVKVIVAVYDQPPYEGYGFVLFRKGGKLYEVNGSHCSCYGLEGQWSPELVDLKSLKHRAEHGDLLSCYDNPSDGKSVAAVIMGLRK